jgi:hypothetical protein
MPAYAHDISCDQIIQTAPPVRVEFTRCGPPGTIFWKGDLVPGIDKIVYAENGDDVLPCDINCSIRKEPSGKYRLLTKAHAGDEPLIREYPTFKRAAEQANRWAAAHFEPDPNG